ncbi:UDP-N-acetylglucosamine 4,6-dehydratase [Robiginitalea sp. IMCC43444]|uniref:UDP-N-acetylglucosamine 4,6-dehydratase n=1 Tax=Robiginitalea sp. IMCC43444 TaxID=3459121 RepID=UPI004041010F
MNILSLIGRNEELFSEDIKERAEALEKMVSTSSFLVIGGAGSIGQAVCKEIFRRQPRKLHVVDISENNLVELVRNIRSSFGYISGDFRTFALDVASKEYDAFIKSDGSYDYVLNLSALKHVRSEKDPFTLMRMIEVNILNTVKTLHQAAENGARKYFCVSTDKAANPVNMMGASKRIMEMFLIRDSANCDVSTARFANVAFSDGSLLWGFENRFRNMQPLVAPTDIRRYFVTPKESGELCLMSCIFGENKDIFFPKPSEQLHLITFEEIARKYVQEKGFKVFECQSEEEARKRMDDLPAKGYWPCLFTPSDTTGEKGFEEFYTASEELDLESFQKIGIVKNKHEADQRMLKYFESEIQRLRTAGKWSKEQIVSLFKELIPNFDHLEKGKYLDSKM